MYLTFVTAFTNHVTGLRVVGELGAKRLALVLLPHMRVSGEDGDAVDVVVIQLIRIACHEIAVVVDLLDVRLFLRRRGHNDVIDGGVFLRRVNFCELTRQLHGSLRNQDIPREGADGVGLVVAIHAVGMHDVDRLVTIILPCQRRLQKQEEPGSQQA